MAASEALRQFFIPRSKLPLHLVQLLVVTAVISLSFARRLMKNTPPGRSTTMGIGMGAKSIVIISYELLTEYVPRLRRWGSLKAYWILNAMEVVFWGAVAYMTIQGNNRVCIGVSCTLGWVILALSISLSILAKYAAVVFFLEWRYFKKANHHSKTAGRQRGTVTRKLDQEESIDSVGMTESNAREMRGVTRG